MRLKQIINFFMLGMVIPIYASNITIIGAGLAGLTAAYRLQKQGHTVIVYEARPRPGGRVLTCYFDEEYNELGGMNINDGGDAPYITSLINELGLPTTKSSIKSDWAYIKQDGTIAPYVELMQSAPQPTQERYKELKKFTNMHDMLDAFLGTHNTLREWMEKRSTGFEGCDTTQLSMYYFDSFWSFYTKNYKNYRNGKKRNFELYTVQGGMTKLIEALCKALDGKIHYEMPLTKIERGNNNAIILTVGKQTIESPYTVLALPISTLRDVAISPDIFPDDQMHMITTLQYGSNAKILIPTRQTTHQAIGTANKATVIINQPPTLWLYFGGQNGIFDSSCSKTLTTMLSNELSHIHTLFPGLQFDTQVHPIPSTTTSFVKVRNPVGISWMHEPFSKGSYSCLAPGQEFAYEKFDTIYGQPQRVMFRPIENKIFFAGEHAAVTIPSTMESAVESAERTASIIDQILQQKIQQEGSCTKSIMPRAMR